jgi:hypothetical protein
MMHRNSIRLQHCNSENRLTIELAIHTRKTLLVLRRHLGTLVHAVMPFLGCAGEILQGPGYAPGGGALPFQLREGGRSEGVSAA